MSDKAIIDIISYFSSQEKSLGKAQLQKLAYLLKEENLDLPYRYHMHYYGPYSFELAEELDNLSFLGKVNLKTSNSGCGFEISTDNKEYNQDIAKNIEDLTRKISSIFGSDDPLRISSLEIITTLRFLTSSLDKDEEIIEEFCRLKPKFSKDYIKKLYPKIKEVFLMPKSLV